jgi:hypothetical protein
MKCDDSTGTKSIREAVKDGLLVDVTETAKKAGMRHPTFMSSGLVAKYEAQAPGVGVLLDLFFFADLLVDYEDDRYGPIFRGPDVCILEPHEEFGLVVLILEEGQAEKHGIKRTTGERCTYPM